MEQSKDIIQLEQKNSMEQQKPKRRPLFDMGIATTTDDTIPLHMQREQFVSIGGNI